MTTLTEVRETLADISRQHPELGSAPDGESVWPKLRMYFHLTDRQEISNDLLRELCVLYYASEKSEEIWIREYREDTNVNKPFYAFLISRFKPNLSLWRNAGLLVWHQAGGGALFSCALKVAAFSGAQPDFEEWERFGFDKSGHNLISTFFNYPEIFRHIKHDSVYLGWPDDTCVADANPSQQVWFDFLLHWELGGYVLNEKTFSGFEENFKLRLCDNFYLDKKWNKLFKRYMAERQSFYQKLQAMGGSLTDGALRQAFRSIQVVAGSGVFVYEEIKAAFDDFEIVCPWPDDALEDMTNEQLMMRYSLLVAVLSQHQKQIKKSSFGRLFLKGVLGQLEDIDNSKDLTYLDKFLQALATYSSTFQNSSVAVTDLADCLLAIGFDNPLLETKNLQELACHFAESQMAGYKAVVEFLNVAFTNSSYAIGSSEPGVVESMSSTDLLSSVFGKLGDFSEHSYQTLYQALHFDYQRETGKSHATFRSDDLVVGLLDKLDAVELCVDTSKERDACQELIALFELAQTTLSSSSGIECLHVRALAEFFRVYSERYQDPERACPPVVAAKYYFGQIFKVVLASGISEEEKQVIDSVEFFFPLNPNSALYRFEQELDELDASHPARTEFFNVLFQLATSEAPTAVKGKIDAVIKKKLEGDESFMKGDIARVLDELKVTYGLARKSSATNYGLEFVAGGFGTGKAGMVDDALTLREGITFEK